MQTTKYADDNCRTFKGYAINLSTMIFDDEREGYLGERKNTKIDGFGKHFGKWSICSWRAYVPVPTLFSKVSCYVGIKTA